MKPQLLAISRRWVRTRKKISLRTSLLLSTSLLLFAGCDQSSDVTAGNAGDDTVGFYNQYQMDTPHQMDTPPPTLSGSFLAGQFAQNRSDWESASDYFAKILDSSPAESDIQRRLMALQMDQVITIKLSLSPIKFPKTLSSKTKPSQALCLPLQSLKQENLIAH